MIGGMSHIFEPLSEPVPVRPLRPRRDGWTAARQQEFLEMLADSGSVAQAARRVGLSRQAAYRLRRHPEAEDFRRAWDLALAEAWRQLPATALERALNGEEEQLERDGVLVAVRRRPCDARLLLALLQREDDRRASTSRIEQELAALRHIIDRLPDRRTWLGERLDPQHFHELDRVPPPVREIRPDPVNLQLTVRRSRIKPVSTS